MNKEKFLQIIAAFMINIIVLIPVTYAQLSNPLVYGQDMIEGYIRDESDLTTFEVDVNEEISDPKQVKLWGISSSTGLGFTDCTESALGYHCYLENLDIAGKGLKVCPSFVNDIKLYSNGELQDVTSVEVVCDKTAPIITKLELSRPIYSSDDTAEIEYTIQDKAEASGKCVGIEKAVFEAGSYSEEIEINTDPGECTYSGTLTVGVDQLLSSEAKLTAYDNFGNSVYRLFNVDPSELPPDTFKLRDAKLYGQDMIEGYVRDAEDLFTFEVKVNSIGEITPSQVRLWGDNYKNGFGFASCTEDETGYTCILDGIDLSQYKLCPYYRHNINLYLKDGTLFDTIKVESFCDNKAPEIVKFQPDKNVYNEEDTVEFTIEIAEKSDLAGKCSGIKNAVIDIGGYSMTIEINGTPGDCTYNDKVNVNASLLAEGQLQAKLTVHDNFGLSDEKTNTIRTDFSGPDISNLEITNAGGGKIGYYIQDQELSVDIKVNYTDDSQLASALLNSNDLELINSQASSCSNGFCVWNNKRVKMKNPSGTITVTLKDNLENSNSEDFPFSFVEDKVIPKIGNLVLKDLKGKELGWNNGKNVKAVLEVEITEGETGLDENKVTADVSALNDNPEYSNLKRKSCNTKGNLSVCKWDVVIDVESETAKQVSFKINAEDNAGNKNERTFDYNLMCDNKAPQISSMVSEYIFKGIYYIGKDSTIIADVVEKGIGLNKSSLYLDLNEIGAGSRVKANNCTSGWECIWENVKANSNDGKKVKVSAFGEDDLGNKAEKIEKEFMIDITDPIIEGINTEPEFPTYKDVMTFYVNVTEKNLVKVEVNTTDISDTGSVDSMYCTEYEGKKDMYECYLEVSDLNTEFTEVMVDIIATDGAGNKAVKKHKVTIYTFETMKEPDFFEIESISFVPGFIDKQAASQIPISVFINPKIKIKDEYNNEKWDPQILSKAVDCSVTEYLSNTGYLLNEFTNQPYVVVKTSTSVSNLEKEYLPIDCNLTLRVKAGKKIYYIPEYEGIKVEVPLYNIPLGTIEENIQDKIEESGIRIEELDDKIETADDWNNFFKIACLVSEIMVTIDSVLQSILTTLAGIACGLEIIPGVGLAIYDAVCVPFAEIHRVVRLVFWDPNLLPIPPTPAWFYKWMCTIYSGFACNAGAVGHLGVEIATAGLDTLVGDDSIIAKRDQKGKSANLNENKKKGESDKSSSGPPEGRTHGQKWEDPNTNKEYKYDLTDGAWYDERGEQYSVGNQGNSGSSGGSTGGSGSDIWSSQARSTAIKSQIEPEYWIFDPYKSINYAKRCFFLPGIIYNYKKEKQIECMRIKCLYENAKLGLPIDVCEKAYDERYCLYVDGAQWKLHGGWSWGRWFESILDYFWQDKARLFTTAVSVACIAFDVAPELDCVEPCASLTDGSRICLMNSAVQAVLDLKDVMSGGVGGFIDNFKPHVKELEGYDYCEDIEDYI